MPILNRSQDPETARLRARCEALARQLAAAEAERDTARGEAVQLREELRVTRLVGEDEKHRTAYEAMDAERRGQESRRAADNLNLVEVKRLAKEVTERLTSERDAARTEVRRLQAAQARAENIVEGAIRKGYDITGVELDDLAEAFGIIR